MSQLPVTFKAKLTKGTAKGAWTTVSMPGSADFFGTRGLVKIKGTINGYPIESSFMALGDGTHMLPVKAEVRNAINKDDGDLVEVTILERTN